MVALYFHLFISRVAAIDRKDSFPPICVFQHKTLQVAIKSLLLWKL